jgi:hypothetical protein
MKDLLIQTAKRTGIVDAEQLAKFLKENDGKSRIDELLLNCPYFTRLSDGNFCPKYLKGLFPSSL